jgi:hypothetical protein
MIRNERFSIVDDIIIKFDLIKIVLSILHKT